LQKRKKCKLPVLSGTKYTTKVQKQESKR